ncbi:MFS transporter [Aquicoccus porphyridii]|uniref:MFS transporter n=1 Tax=Aquicoccus porphyridii TaxID=1852029 RepID=A0A5A9Z8H0_9RHOB|nr:MFS transporter [Aquicoccus porphyridii]KAA0913245.1 MFS transporter [Aquicoccus porphyridii]RAI52262.1 MFS transporter [Rhodobacteraceae bacterium AsT-22]
MSTLRFLRDNLPWLSAGMLLTFMSGPGQTFFISIFAGHIREEFGLTHGQWGTIYTLGTGASAILMVWAGGLTDRFRVRALGAVVLVLTASACLFMASVRAAWLLPFVIFALRFTGQGMTSHLAVVAMSRWFIATRGRALSIATLGFTLGEAVLPVTFVALMALFDWRLLWVLAAGIAIAAIPVLLLLLRQERTPQSFAQSDSTLGMQGRHWTRNQALRHFLFWFMVPAMLGPAAFNTAFFFHQVHYAEIKGLAHIELVSLFPIYTGLSVISMMIGGALLDRLGTARLMPFTQLPIIIGFLCYSIAPGLGMTLLGLLFMAMTTGAMMTVPNAFWAEFYGTRYIGSVKAMIAAVMVFGSAIGPGITGLGIDAGLGIETQFLIIASYFLFTTLMMIIGVGRARALLSVSA